jgi:RES domain-containing protein
MQVFRLQKSKFNANDSLTGYGSCISGGRWNNPNTFCVYTSQSISLALLEIVAHLNIPEAFYIEPYNIITIEIDDTFIFDYTTTLPRLWNTFPPTPIAVSRTNDLLLSGKHMYLKVPSVIVSSEYNYILNPSHPGYYSHTKIIKSELFEIDKRIIRKPKAI